MLAGAVPAHEGQCEFPSEFGIAYSCPDCGRADNEPMPGVYTGRSFERVVTHLTPGGAWGLSPDLCVMSIVDPTASPAARAALPQR